MAYTINICNLITQLNTSSFKKETHSLQIPTLCIGKLTHKKEKHTRSQVMRFPPDSTKPLLQSLYGMTVLSK